MIFSAAAKPCIWPFCITNKLIDGHTMFGVTANNSVASHYCLHKRSDSLRTFFSLVHFNTAAYIQCPGLNRRYGAGSILCLEPACQDQRTGKLGYLLPVKTLPGSTWYAGNP